MPDDRLFQLAGKGRLTDQAVRQAQVRRMLKDPRARQFANHFADQWLDLPALDRVAVNPEFHPTFDDRLKRDMRDETRHFFAEILNADLSALNLLKSDFAMLNRRLAGHYGIPLPPGGDMQRVKLSEGSHRGGLLTQGSFLLSNSNGEDSHPIKRAVWVLDRLLDDPPAPPPPDVPDLDPSRPNLAKAVTEAATGSAPQEGSLQQLSPADRSVGGGVRELRRGGPVADRRHRTSKEKTGPTAR
ncbi:MAG: hypothetical protein Ct9H300mP1_02860 [Planctomycetaceae bacterium]|nr:MAG: hypothetical protein Ct9H300mP1_02860 [Planctomycetaceae bacterium]